MPDDKFITLHQIFSRLCFHSGATPEQHADKREHFIARLFSYPEDLICAAYHYSVRHAKPSHIPSEEEFIAFMAPEFTRRQKQMEGV